MTTPDPTRSSHSSDRSKALARRTLAKKTGYTALQLALSPREYEYVRGKLPVDIRKRAITRNELEKMFPEDLQPGRQFILGSARAGVRVFVMLRFGLKVLEIVTARLAARRGGKSPPKPPGLSDDTRLSLSFGAIVFIYRLLFRFFSRLRQNIQDPSAARFREKHPKIYKILSSRLAPSVGPALAGLALAIHPANSRRTTIAVYALSRALEVSYNGAELAGAVKGKPWWFGSWLLFPLSSAQLLHAFVFDRDCFPDAYGNFIMSYSNEYVQKRPLDYPRHLEWPTTSQIIDGVGEIAKLKYPAFQSPVITPSATLPASLSPISAIIEPAHPTITSLQCALLHPSNPSCGKTYLQQFLANLPRVSKLLFVLYTLTWIPRYSALLKDPTRAFTKIGKSTLLTSTFISGAIASSWGSLCLLQKLLPRSLLPTSRFALAGGLGGLWAFIDRTHGRANFLYSLRLSIISMWKVGVKRRWWRGVKNGDVLVFVASLAVCAVVHEWRREALGGAGKWVVRGLRGSEGGRVLGEAEREKKDE